MATIGFALTTVQQPAAPLPAQTGITPGPQANATSAQGTAQPQDTVTLAGRTAESEQTQTGGGNAQFGEAAAFFLAESQTFRAGNGSAAAQPAQTSTVPTLPVKLTDEATSGQNAAPAANTALAAAGANTLNEAVSNTAATAPATNSTNAATGSSAGAADTPMAELAQLDDTLQKMGVDPQSISLFNRMAMLLYANDPAALKVLVQTLQTGAQLTTASNSNAAGGTSAAQLQLLPAPILSSNAPVPAAQNQSSAASEQTAPAIAQLTAIAQQTDAGGTVPNQSGTQLASIASAGSTATAGTGNSGTPNQTYQPASFSIQLEELNFAFAVVGAQQGADSQQNSPSGQTLNVTA